MRARTSHECRDESSESKSQRQRGAPTDASTARTVEHTGAAPTTDRTSSPALRLLVERTLVRGHVHAHVAKVVATHGAAPVLAADEVAHVAKVRGAVCGAA